MRTDELTPDQSIAIIRDMISKTRENLEDRGSKDLLIFGYTSFFCNGHRLRAAHLHPKPDLHVGVVGYSGCWLPYLVPCQ